MPEEIKSLDPTEEELAQATKIIKTEIPEDDIEKGQVQVLAKLIKKIREEVDSIDFDEDSFYWLIFLAIELDKKSAEDELINTLADSIGYNIAIKKMDVASVLSSTYLSMSI